MFAVSSSPNIYMGVNSLNRILQKYVPNKEISVTNTILHLLQLGRLPKAVSLLFASPFPFELPLYGRLFQLCSANRAIVEARKVESHLVTYYDPPPTFLLNRAIEAYAKCRCLRDARELFDEMPHRDGGSWNALITGFAKAGLSSETLSLFLEMNRSRFSPSEVTFASVLGCCGDELGLQFSRAVHGCIVKRGFIRNVILASALVDVYGKYGEMVESRKMFDDISSPNDVSWNVIVRRYLEVGDEKETILMFFKMIREGVKPLKFTFSSALVACSAKQAFMEGMQIHVVAIKLTYEDDEKVATSLIDMYVKCNDVASARRVFDQTKEKDLLSWTSIVSGYAFAGRLKEARGLFDEMPKRSIVSWNALLAGYVHSGQWQEALDFIFLMLKDTSVVDAVTLNLVLNVFSALSGVKFGKQVHAYIYRHGFESNAYVSNGLIDMYGKCGALISAKNCFDSSWRDTISWNSLMSSMTQHKMDKDVLIMFPEMQKEAPPNEYSFATLLSACANVSTLKHGKNIHGFMIRNGYEIDVVVLGAMIDMYYKCRCLEYALRVFKIANPGDVILWNSMIIGCCHHNKAAEALDLFDLMKEIGVDPDSATFLAVFKACICGGYVNEGKKYFEAMRIKYCITTRLEHYGCMIDLYTRYGAMTELDNLFKTMPFEPTISMLTRIYNACIKYRHCSLGKQVAEKLNKLNPSAGPFHYNI